MTGSACSPTGESPLPGLAPRQEVDLSARTLWHEGNDDQLAGHISSRRPDGTPRCTPWLLLREVL